MPLTDTMTIEKLDRGYLVEKNDQKLAFDTLAQVADQLVGFLRYGTVKVRLTIEEIEDEP